jgi:coproporphyrinogen III oxidase-like Fe-S oxidoreductase
MSRYYLGPTPTNDIPFDDLQTIQHFIVPNFATMTWEKIGHENALKHFARLHDDSDAVYDDIMLYIHIPYCLSMCHYCNFNKFQYPFHEEDSLGTYVDYLIKELDYYLRLPYVQSRKLTAVYFGGGSPSVLPPRHADRLFAHLSKVIPGWNGLERTFTGEPRTLKNPELLKLLVDYGFNRVTFGVESFNEDIRKQIGRWDTLQDVAALFSNLEKVQYKGEKDIDLMFDLPGQTLKGFQEELDIMMREFRPDELDAYGTVYLPYRALHKLIVQEKRPQPGNMWQLLQMREYLYDFMTAHGYHNTIAETWSRNKERTQYQTAHCARQNIIGIGTAARSNLKDMVSINPEKVDRWMKNIDEHGVSSETLQTIGREGVLERIMVMFPRYKELTKKYLAEFSDAPNFEKMKSILRRHVEAGVVDEHEDRFTINKLGVIWICNLQTDYMRPSFNMLGKVLIKVLSDKPKNFGCQERFRVNPLTQFIANNIDRYPKLMK